MATQGRRRAYGQHFLRNERLAILIAEAAVGAALKSECTQMLEIGPGRGAITFPLLACLEEQSQIQELVLCEKDKDLALRWENEKGIHPILKRVETADFMELPDEKWLPSGILGVVSNLPYSVGTAILTRLAMHSDKIPVMTLMFQAEVAKRLRAESSTKDWGSLSVWIQNRWDVTKLYSVPPRDFSPPPQVDSEVVVLQRRAALRVPSSEHKNDSWTALLKVCFAHRRKMLRSGLPKASPYQNALALSGLDGTKRSESLDWDEWSRLHTALLTVMERK